MPSDKRNLIMARAIGLIISLISVALSQDVPFCQPQQLQCLNHGSTKGYLCFPLFFIPFSHYHVDDDLQYTRYGFSARLGLRTKLAVMLLMLFMLP